MNELSEKQNIYLRRLRLRRELVSEKAEPAANSAKNGVGVLSEEQKSNLRRLRFRRELVSEKAEPDSLGQFGKEWSGGAV